MPEAYNCYKAALKWSTGSQVLKPCAWLQVRREKCDTEQRLQERSIIEQDLKSECSKLASALAACQTANEAAIQRVQEAAAAHEQEALSLARTSAYQEASKAAEQTQQHELEQAKVQFPPVTSMVAVVAS